MGREKAGLFDSAFLFVSPEKTFSYSFVSHRLMNVSFDNHHLQN